MKRFTFVVVLLAMVAMFAASVSAAEVNNGVVNKSFVVSAFDPSEADLTSFELRLANPDNTPTCGSEVSFGYTRNVNYFKQRSEVQRYGMAIGRYAKKSIYSIGVGAGVFIVDTGSDTEGYGGVYGRVSLDLTKNVYVDAKYTEVIDAPAGTGWQFGLGINF